MDTPAGFAAFGCCVRLTGLKRAGGGVRALSTTCDLVFIRRWVVAAVGTLLPPRGRLLGLYEESGVWPFSPCEEVLRVALALELRGVDRESLLA